MAAVTLLKANLRDIGAFRVRRVLPAAKRQSVGPFLFFDHFGPMAVAPGAGHDVRPHPHIGLSTVSYLFEGAIVHRDSIGAVQRIEPGAVNWMTAGRGIVHSERTPADLANVAYRTHGLQLWAALPKSHEEAAPAFSHTPASAFPSFPVGQAGVRVLVGRAWDAESPVPVLMETLYVDIELPAGGALDIPPLAQERALYPVLGAIEVDGRSFGPGEMAVLEGGDSVTIRATQPARLVLIGGEPLDGHRFIWWNFVSSRRERIAEAAEQWERRAFDPIPGDDEERIPLPEKRL